MQVRRTKMTIWTLRAVIAACALSIGGCTTDPGYNTTAGGLGGAAAGCAIGAAVTAPLFGVGCVPGALIGGAAGAGTGLASTPPPPPPPPPPPLSYYSYPGGAW